MLLVKQRAGRGRANSPDRFIIIFNRVVSAGLGLERWRNAWHPKANWRMGQIAFPPCVRAWCVEVNADQGRGRCPDLAPTPMTSAVQQVVGHLGYSGRAVNALARQPLSCEGFRTAAVMDVPHALRPASENLRGTKPPHKATY